MDVSLDIVHIIKLRQKSFVECIATFVQYNIIEVFYLYEIIAWEHMAHHEGLVMVKGYGWGDH